MKKIIEIMIGVLALFGVLGSIALGVFTLVGLFQSYQPNFPTWFTTPTQEQQEIWNNKNNELERARQKVYNLNK